MSRVAVIACGALALDVRAIARRRGWEVDVHPVPALLHNRPERIPPAVAAEVERLRGRYDRVVVAYGDCGTYGGLDELCARTRARAAGGRALLRPVRPRRGARGDGGGAGHLLPDRLPRAHVRAHRRARARPRPPPRSLCEEYFRNYTRVVWLAQRPTRPTDAAAARAAATGSACRSRCGRSATAGSSGRWGTS